MTSDEADAAMPRRRIRNRFRLVVVISLLLAAAVSLFVARTSHGVDVHSRVSLHRAAPQLSSATPVQQTEPIHWASTRGPHISGTVDTQESENWSGYVDTGPTFSAISSQWVVPTVQPSAAPEYSATWIGIDGVNNTSLIQTGTSQDTSNGTTSYEDWYEILPANETVIGNVSPGDHMVASIDESSPGTWTITIDDITSGQSFLQLFAYSGPQTSAEWIEEAPTVSGSQSTLADFGTAMFTSTTDTNSGSSSVVQSPVDMINGGGTVIASPGATSGNSFTDTYDGPASSPAATTTVASVNPAASTSGSSVTFSATVSSNEGTPPGTVAFTTGSTTLCSAVLGGGSASCSSTTAPMGSDTIVASYGGGPSFTLSSGSASLDVGSPSSSTTTTTTTTTSSPTTTTTPPPPMSTPAQHGYWLVGSDGGIFTFGAAQFYGSTGALTLQRPVVGIALTPDRKGYWLVASDGGIFTFGDAGYYGSVPELGIAPSGTAGTVKKLNAPIVGIVPSSDGGGYFMVASDGGVFAFGDAKFEGSCPGIGGCSGAAVAVTPDSSGKGYWLVTAIGHVYTFGDAAYYGAPGPQGSPVTSAIRTPDGKGYWILCANGLVAAYGDAISLGGSAGQTGGPNAATAIYSTSDGEGYWITSEVGTVYTFGDAPNDGSTAGTHLDGSIVAAAGF